MDLMLTISKLVITVVSFIGLCMFIHRKTKININFIPILTIGAITISMFLGGIINILNYMWLGLLIFGLYIFIKEAFLFMKNNKIEKNIINFSNCKSYLGIIISTIIFILIAYSLKNMIYLHYDNFTHWGLILKEMFRIGSLPDSQTVIEFKLYPPGTALFIYYITKIFGFKESYTLIAQAFMVIMGIVPVFAFYSIDKENKKQGILKIIWSVITYVFILVIILFIYPFQHLENLLVDVVLATTALASTLSIIYYKKDMKNMLISQIIFCTLLILIKNSAIIFIMFNTILALIYTFKYSINNQENRKKAMLKVILILIVVPIILFFLWNRYTLKAYQTRQVGTSTHAMSPRNYYSIVIKKDAIALKEISLNVIKESINIKAKYTAFKIFAVIEAFILLGLFYFIIRKDKRFKNMFRLLLFVNVVYITYILGLLIMYIFSMPLEEARDLAGFHRYLATIVIYIVGIAFSSFIYLYNENEKSKSTSSIVITIIIVTLLLLNKDNINIFKRTDISNVEIVKIQNAFDSNINIINKDKKALIYSSYPKSTRGYISRIITYILLSKNILIVGEEEYIKNKSLYQTTVDYVVEINKDRYFINKTEKAK